MVWSAERIVYLMLYNKWIFSTRLVYSCNTINTRISHTTSQYHRMNNTITHVSVCKAVNWFCYITSRTSQLYRFEFVVTRPNATKRLRHRLRTVSWSNPTVIGCRLLSRRSRGKFVSNIQVFAKSSYLFISRVMCSNVCTRACITGNTGEPVQIKCQRHELYIFLI